MQEKKRIYMLDLLRGVSVLLMIMFHVIYTFGEVLGFPFFVKAYEALRFTAPPVIATLFIFISTYSCSLSKNNIKRGAVIFGVALGISFVTIFILPLLGMEREGIFFGILHFFGVALMCSPLIFGIEKRIPWFVGVPLLAVLSWGMRDLSAYGFFGIPVSDPFSNTANILFPFGIYHGDFYSADYYSIFPWIFVFAIGCYLPKLFPKEKLPSVFYKRKCRVLEFVGRHTLIIYVVHQPIIFFVGTMIQHLTK